jgi:hypothetical protein
VIGARLGPYPLLAQLAPAACRESMLAKVRRHRGNLDPWICRSGSAGAFAT